MKRPPIVARLTRRLTARLRIALAFSALFFLGGLAFAGVVYGLVRGDLLAPTSAGRPAIIDPEDDQQEQLERQVRESVREEELRALALRFGFVLAGFTCGSGVAGWLLAGVVLRPVNRITDIARRAGTENLDRRVHLEGPDDELKELADTFDEMLDRLQAGIEARRAFAANAAHELRTPLAVIQTATDVGLGGEGGPTPDALAEAIADIRSATSQAEQLIEGLLELARSENGLRDPRAVALDLVVQDALAQAEPAVAERGIVLVAEIAPATAWGDPTLMELAVVNLVANAVRHNNEGGRFEISLEESGGRAVLDVKSDGEALDPERAGSLVEPFVRGGGSRVGDGRRGAGLGLSIVAAVVSAHGGELRLDPRPEGGLRVTVELPGSPPS